MFAEQFAAVVPGQNVAIVDRSSIERALGEAALDERAPDPELMTYLHRIEAEHDMTLLVADDADDAWTRLCIRHADVNLLVGHAPGLTNRGAAESALLSEAETPGRPETHLIVLRVAGSPTGTSRIRAGRDVARVHHVFAWDDNDVARVARIVSGASVGLVLGGGGARGFAHLGAIRALMEARIPIDHVGGTSIGAVVAGIYALGGKWDEMVGKALMATVERKSLIDFSFPAVALAAGERLGISIRDIFADGEMEDLALDFFCTSTDLTTGSVHVHTSGAMWRAIRASVSIPGIFPPVSGPDGKVLVDGGVLDNLPIDVMRRLYRPSVVIASDVQGSAPLPSADLGNDGVVSGWSVAGRRYAWRTSPMEVPRMIDTLMSASAVTGRHSKDEADLVLRPPVDGYAILDFKSHATIIEAGYQHAVGRLASWADP